MRPKIAMFVVGIGLAILIGLSVLRSNRQDGAISSAALASQSGSSTSPGRPAAESKAGLTVSNAGAVASNSAAFSTAASVSETPTPASAAPAIKSTTQKPAASPEEYVERRVGELMDLGMTDDPSALKTILSEVNNPEGDIRKAAIEAAKQFGSTNAIPSLEEAISKTESVEDRQDLREAIEFLKLPSIFAKRN